MGLNNTVKVSSLAKTWILDLDGTVVKHNGYKIDGHDTLLDGAKEFLDSIPDSDMIIFLTSRTSKYAAQTELFLRENAIIYNAIIYNAPYGERILINDAKPSGLQTAIAINTERNIFMKQQFKIEDDL